MSTLAASATSVDATASCDPGDAVAGGGIDFTQAGALTQVIYSQRSEPTAAGNGWFGQVEANPNSTGFAPNSALEVSARCVRLIP